MKTDLTPREIEVLRLIANGKTSKEIANQLIVTIATVSRHVASIYTKIDARGRADATRYAVEHGLIDPPGDWSDGLAGKPSPLKPPPGHFPPAGAAVPSPRPPTPQVDAFGKPQTEVQSQ